MVKMYTQTPQVMKGLQLKPNLNEMVIQKVHSYNAPLQKHS